MKADDIRDIWAAGYEVGYRHGRDGEAEVRERRAPADPDHAAPTYVSGSSDRVYLISEMPTRYIRNVLAMPDGRQANGLVGALFGELHRRGEVA